MTTSEMLERKTAPSMAVAHTMAYTPGWISMLGGTTSSSSRPSRAPKALPIRMHGLRQQGGGAGVEWRV